MEITEIIVVAGSLIVIFGIFFKLHEDRLKRSEADIKDMKADRNKMDGTIKDIYKTLIDKLEADRNKMDGKIEHIYTILIDNSMKIADWIAMSSSSHKKGNPYDSIEMRQLLRKYRERNISLEEATRLQRMLKEHFEEVGAVSEDFGTIAESVMLTGLAATIALLESKEERFKNLISSVARGYRFWEKLYDVEFDNKEFDIIIHKKGLLKPLPVVIFDLVFGKRIGLEEVDKFKNKVEKIMPHLRDSRPYIGSYKKEKGYDVKVAYLAIDHTPGNEVTDKIEQLKNESFPIDTFLVKDDISHRYIEEILYKAFRGT